MARKHYQVTTALGLGLAAGALTATAETSEDLFAAEMLVCLEAQTAEACAPVGTLLPRCAEDIGLSECDALLGDPAAVRNDPALRDSAEAALRQTRDALAAIEAADAAPGATPPPEATAETAGAEAPDPDAEVLAEPAEPATPDPAGLDAVEPIEAEAAPAAPDDRPAAAETAAEDDALADTAPAADGADAAAEETAPGPTLEAETAAPDTAQAPATAGAAAEETATEQTAPQETAAEETAIGDTATGDAATGDAATEDAALAGERARLRAEAEAMAAEEPELIVEDVAAEEFVAPADAPRDLAPEQRSALERLVREPEIAEALAVLGGALAGIEAAEEAEAPGARLAAALAALRPDVGTTPEAETAAPGETAAPARVQAEEVIVEDVTAAEARTSRDDFGSPLALDFRPEQVARERRRDLERAGLAALAGLAVGMIVNQNRVVARSDERVVVQRDDGEFAVWRDDDMILRQEGAQRRIERFADGSTLTRWDRPDGSQIVSVRDATGRLLWRERVLADGTSIPLVDDLREPGRIDVTTLPPPQRRELRISPRTDPELALAMLREAEADARALGRAFTLRQIRELREVRELVPVLSPEPITFETNRANVRPTEAPKLAQLGRLIERMIAADPGEVFLVEGHTDATGPAAFNLALSDRRAESVALALTEFFDIPPENLVIQGYGERYLLIPTAAAEERNRRVTVRRITPLLGR